MSTIISVHCSHAHTHTQIRLSQTQSTIHPSVVPHRAASSRAVCCPPSSAFTAPTHTHTDQSQLTRQSARYRLRWEGRGSQIDRKGSDIGYGAEIYKVVERRGHGYILDKQDGSPLTITRALAGGGYKTIRPLIDRADLLKVPGPKARNAYSEWINNITVSINNTMVMKSR